MTDLIEEARRIAEYAHLGQTNPKNGEPYIRHPERVAVYTRMTAEWMGLTEPDRQRAIAAAWLHDVIEDTPVTMESLRGLGVPGPVLLAVVVLTRTESITEKNYYRRIASDRIARAVKWADMIDNTDPGRMAVLPIAVAHRLIEKYDRGAACLNLDPTPRQWWEQQVAMGRQPSTNPV